LTSLPESVVILVLGALIVILVDALSLAPGKKAGSLAGSAGSKELRAPPADGGTPFPTRAMLLTATVFAVMPLTMGKIRNESSYALRFRILCW
jgi:preprotein translocase subunit SecG